MPVNIDTGKPVHSTGKYGMDPCLEYAKTHIGWETLVTYSIDKLPESALDEKTSKPKTGLGVYAEITAAHSYEDGAKKACATIDVEVHEFFPFNGAKQATDPHGSATKYGADCEVRQKGIRLGEGEVFCCRLVSEVKIKAWLARGHTKTLRDGGVLLEPITKKHEDSAKGPAYVIYSRPTLWTKKMGYDADGKPIKKKGPASDRSDSVDIEKLDKGDPAKKEYKAVVDHCKGRPKQLAGNETVPATEAGSAGTIPSEPVDDQALAESGLSDCLRSTCQPLAEGEREELSAGVEPRHRRVAREVEGAADEGAPDQGL
jgi:hypothetical protein